MKLVRILVVAAAVAGLPALGMAQSNTAAGAASGGAIGGFLSGPAGAFAGGVLGGATGAAADTNRVPFYEGRSVHVGPAPAYVAPGPVYVMPDEAPMPRRCRINVYGERQCESFR